MAQRFGRNQRRRAREALAAMTQANAMNEGLLHQVSQDNRALLDIVSEVRQVLGNHPALPPEDEGNHPHPLGGDFDVPVRQHVDWRGDPGPQFEPVPLVVARMHEMLVRVKPQAHADEIHCRVSLDSGEVVYCITGAAVRALGRTPGLLAQRLTREIAPRLGQQLSRVLCKGGA